MKVRRDKQEDGREIEGWKDHKNREMEEIMESTAVCSSPCSFAVSVKLSAAEEGGGE